MTDYRELLTIEPVFKTADGKVFKTVSEAKYAADRLAVMGALASCSDVYLTDRQCSVLATCLLKNFSFCLNPHEMDQAQQELPLELSQEIQQEADKLSDFVSGLTSMVG